MVDMKNMPFTIKYPYNSDLLLALICCCFIISGCGKKQKIEKKDDSVKVKVSRLAKQQFRRQIRVQGVIQPVNKVTIAARISGTINSLNVEEGSRVKKGDILFQTDRKNLENQVKVERQNLKVMEETCQTARMDVEIAHTNLKKAKLDYTRNKTLYDKRVVSEANYENAEAAWKNATRAVDKAQAVLSYSKVKIEQARTNLEIAQKNLADSIIRAPYDGIITQQYLESGEFAAVGAKVLEMEDQNTLEASACISSLYYEELSLKTEIVLNFAGRELCRTELSYISPSVDPLSRTFEIKAKLPCRKNLVCGTLCDITIIIAERNGLGVPTDAVLARAGGKYAVFAVNGEKAQEITVQPGFSTDGYTEILDAEKLKGRDLVISGQYFLNDGSAVKIVNGNGK